MAAPLDDQPVASCQQRRRRLQDQVEALLRVQPADRPEDRPVVGGVEADTRQQVRPTSRLPAPIRPRIAGCQVLVGRGIPDRCVQAVQDAQEPVTPGPERPVQAHPELRRQRLRGEPRRDRVDQLCPLDPDLQEVDPRAICLADAVAR